MKEAALGMMHSIAFNTSGRLYGWGKGPATGLDKGDNTVFSTPQPIALNGNMDYQCTQVTSGPMHTMVLLKDGSLYLCGSGADHRMPAFEKIQKRDIYCPKKLIQACRDRIQACLEEDTVRRTWMNLGRSSQWVERKGGILPKSPSMKRCHFSWLLEAAIQQWC
jgi:alpha-tubulin suppressor-like RCC1 family protein